MMRAIGLLALLAVLDMGAAIAQTATSPSQTITGGVPEAPIGHRQPRASDVPDEKNSDLSINNPNDPLNKENAALDRKLKGICRGCENERAQPAMRGKDKTGLRNILGLGAVAPSLAADLPERPYSAPASYVPIGYDWTGLYVGANGGYGTAEDCLRVSGPLNVSIEEGCHNAGGGIAGGQVGYRWQFEGAPMVWGLEVQGDWASLRGSHLSSNDPTITHRTELQGFGLFTGQFGYALNNVFFYGKGGAAVTSDRYEDISTASGAVLGSVSQTRWGGTAGAGVEYGFAPNWTAAFEYDRLFMGDKNVTYISPAGVLFANKQLGRNVDLFTVRINYKFGGPGVVMWSSSRRVVE